MQPYFDDADTARLVTSKDSVKVPMSNVTVTVVKEPFNWAHFVFALLSSICCCAMCGLPALALSLLGHSDHHAGNMAGYRYKKRWAIACTVLAVFTAVIFITLYAIYVFPVVAPMVQQYVQMLQMNNEESVANINNNEQYNIPPTP